MTSVRRRFWAGAGLLLLLFGLAPSLAHGLESRQSVACATPAVDLRQRMGPAVRNCAPPASPASPVSHDGFRPIAWVLHPDAPLPGPASRSIVVAVREVACTGGRDPIPHLQRPEIGYLKKAVVITLWIEVLEGIHTCPGNPIGRLRVKLPGRLGLRQLYDGSSDPPRKVEPGELPPRWPYP